MCPSQTFSQCQTFMGVIKPSVVQMCHVQHIVEPVNLNWCHPAFILLPPWHVALSKDMKGTSYFLLPTSAFPKIQVHFLLLEGYNLLVAISLSRGGFSRWCCCHIARGALQGHERHFLLIRHVPKFIDSYHIVAWRFFKDTKNTSYQFDMCHPNCLNKTNWYYPAFRM